MSEIEFVKQFLDDVLRHAKQKAKLYDGADVAGRTNIDMSPDFFLRYAIEELGEVSSAMTRERWQLAIEECIDLAHTAILIALAITTKEIDNVN